MRVCHLVCLSLSLHTHTHTHTHIWLQTIADNKSWIIERNKLCARVFGLEVWWLFFKGTIHLSTNHTSKSYKNMLFTKKKSTSYLSSKPQLLNPARPGTRSTRWLDRSGFNKRSAVATTRPNPGDPEPGWPRRTRTRPGFFFFFQMWDLKPISIYTLCFHEKNHVFSMWDKNLLV